MPLEKISDYFWFQEGPGVRNTQYTKSGVKLLNVRNLVNGHLDLSNTERFISEEEAYGRYAHFLVEPGDMIIASSGIKIETFCEKIVFASESDLPLCMNTSTIRFKSKDSSVANIKYFMYYLKSKSFMLQLSKQITGSAQLNFGPYHLNRMYFPLIPIKEQNSIVNILTFVDDIRGLVDKEIKLYENLVKSQFIEMFDKKNFGKVRISDVVDKNILSVKKAYKKMDFIKYIDIGSIDNKSNLITSFKTYLVEEAPSRAQQCISYNDILVSTVRPNLKNIAINKYDGNDFVASSGFCVLRSTKINPHFLLYCVLQNDFTDSMVSKMTGANYPAIKNSDVYSYEVFNAPNALQDKFASFVNQVDKSKFRLKQLHEKLDNLYKSLLQKYFA